MKEIKDLKFGFNDAENYKRPENKAVFDKYFLRTTEFNEIFKPSTNFIIGEKGTGKTAYATYIVNNEVYKVYAGLNLVYPYPFVTVYHVDNNIVSIHPSFSHELKVGVYYNDFNASLGLSTIYLKKAYSNTETTDKINRLSVNVGYLLF